MQRVEANIAVSITDLKKRPSAILDEAEGQAVAVLNHNRIIAYMVSAEAYEEMLELIDDFYLAEIIEKRAGEKGEPVILDDL